MNVVQTQAVAVVEPRRSLLVEMSGRYGMEPKAFADTLRATVIPKDTSNEEFAAFLVVAREYDLNPLTKEIYAFPKRGGGIQPIVSIDGWTNIINSHPALDGIEFDDHLDDKGKLTAITARIWRKDRAKPTVVTEYMAECVRNTDTWKQWPRRMLRHKALIQGARYAFGFAGIVDPDEAERMGADVSKLRDVTPHDDEQPPPVTAQLTKPAETPADKSELTEDEALALVESGAAPQGDVVWGDDFPPDDQSPSVGDAGTTPTAAAPAKASSLTPPKAGAASLSGLLRELPQNKSMGDLLHWTRESQTRIDGLSKPDRLAFDKELLATQTQLKKRADA